MPPSSPEEVCPLWRSSCATSCARHAPRPAAPRSAAPWEEAFAEAPRGRDPNGDEEDKGRALAVAFWYYIVAGEGAYAEASRLLERHRFPFRLRLQFPFRERARRAESACAAAAGAPRLARPQRVAPRGVGRRRGRGVLGREERTRASARAATHR